jgi:hypothetical protein
LTPQDCTKAGYALVPDLTPLHEVAMPDGGSLAAMRNEPVLARGRVFIATNVGHVYMLEPEKDIAAIIPAIFAPDILTIVSEFVTIPVENN